MTTYVNTGAVRALLTGRTPIWRVSNPTFLLRTSQNLESGTTLKSATNPPRIYFYEVPTFGGSTPAQLRLRGRVLFTNVTITAGTTYYIVATGYIANPITKTLTTTLLWWSDFVAAESLANDYLSVGYPNNTVFEV